MSTTFNKPGSKTRRKYFRKNPTKAERLLWQKLRGSNLAELKFRRQYGVYNYILDFYCPQYRVAIEIIGDVHGYKSRINTDTIRQRRIEALGIRILTYTNGQIIDGMDDVLNDILSNLPLTPSFIRRGRKETN
jgi:very-short-patch-repair endonuclease